MLSRSTFSLEGFAAGWATFNTTEIEIAGNRDMADRRRRPVMLSKWKNPKATAVG